MLENLLNIRPKVATIELRQLKFNPYDDGADSKATLNLNGISMEVILSHDAKRDIIALSGLSQEAVNTIRSTAGEKAAAALLAHALKDQARRQVVLAFAGPRITRVVQPKKNARAISNVKLVQLIELLVSRRGMKIWGVQISDDCTMATVQLVNPDIHEMPTTLNEDIQIGRSFHWDALGGTTIHAFVNRMTCSNGMVRSIDGEALEILTPDADPVTIIDQLFMVDDNKRVRSYFEKVRLLTETKMSAREWAQVAKLLTAFGSDREVFRNHLGIETVTSPWWEAEYGRVGIDLHSLNNKQLANCPVPVIWWDAINCLTWLGSHETSIGINTYRQGKILTEAGKFTSRKFYDSQAWMTGLPTF